MTFSASPGYCRRIRFGQRQRHALGGREAIFAVEDHAVAAVEHQDRRARALIFPLRHHEVFVLNIDDRARVVLPRSRVPVGALNRVQDGAARIQVQGVAELVGLGRGDRFDAGRVVAGVVAAEAALAERAEQIAQRAIAEEIEALVGHLEPRRRRIGSEPASGAGRLPVGARRFEIGGRRDEALLHHAIDDVLNQLFELRARVGLIGVGGIAQQALERLFGQHPAVEERVHDGVVQRLHGAIVFGLAVHAAVGRLKSAGEQQVGQLLDQIVEVEIVERVAGVFAVLVFHWSCQGQGVRAG